MLGMMPATAKPKRFLNVGSRTLPRQLGSSQVVALAQPPLISKMPAPCACGGGCSKCQRTKSRSVSDDVHFLKISGSGTHPTADLGESEQNQENYPIELFGHDEDCKQKDLEDHIWPADYLARKMLAKATKAVFRLPIHSKAQHQLWRYFDSRNPKGEELKKIQDTFVKLKVAFNTSDYLYDCLEESDECGEGDVAYTRFLTGSNINLCMKEFRKVSRGIEAGSIIHEMVHIRMKWRDQKYCRYAGNECEGCPGDLMNSLENPDSYACFAEEVWPLDVD